MKDYTWIDHTADLGIRVKAKTLKDLFVHSAAAMFDVVAVAGPQAASAPARTLTMELDAETTEQLLLDWLGELVSLSDSEQLIFTGFTVKALRETFLEAETTGVSRQYFDIRREIKAVTYHDLKIRLDKDGYEASVIFDV